jgi:hypothetical protein
MGFTGQPIRNRRLRHTNAGSDLALRFVATREVSRIRALLRPDPDQVLSRISPNWTKFWSPGSPPVGVPCA